MDTPQHFRTAINGFRREDVVRYLEYLNAKHTTEINRYVSEIDTLRKDLSKLQEAQGDAPEETAENQDLTELRRQLEESQAARKTLEEKVSSLEAAPAAEKDPEEDADLKAILEENDSLRARCKELEEKAAQQEKACADLKEELVTLKASEDVPAKNLAEQELEAYRRAERAERVANEKADVIYNRTNSVLDEASGKIEGASAELSQLAEKINGQLQQMQYSINSSKIALKSAVDTMQALRADNK